MIALARRQAASFSAALLVALILPATPSALAIPGDLDPSFGVGGKVITDFGSSDRASTVATQPDGKILVAGRTFPSESTSEFQLVRYRTDGSLDSGFGTGGRVVTDFGGINWDGADLALQSDGRIVVAGTILFPDKALFGLARYLSDGSLDSSFGPGGKVTTDFSPTHLEGIALQRDGKIVAAGSISQDVILTRYNPNGSIDVTFGTLGKVTTPDILDVKDLAIQTDGKILIGGGTSPLRTPQGFALVRYNPDGSVDSSFGQAGKVTTDIGGYADLIWSFAVQTDGRIIAAGHTCVDQCADTDLALARYQSDGTLDSTFGVDGVVTTDIGPFHEVARDIALQADGKILLTWDEARGMFALARYNTDGSLDAGFGAGGKITTFMGASGSSTSVALQSDGKIVLAGSVLAFCCPAVFRFSLARYLGGVGPPPPPPPSPVVVGLGDSVAAGHGLGKSDGFPDNPKAYPAILGRMLGLQSLNYAISGACAASHGGNGSDPRTPGGPSDPFNPNSCRKSILNNQLGQVAQVNPKVITITVGANDIQFSECFRALVEGYEHVRDKDPCAQPTLTQRLRALEANLKVVIGRIKDRFRDAKIALTKYFNPLAPIAGGTNACVLYKVAAATQSPNLIGKGKAWESAAKTAQTKAFVYGSNILAKLNDTLERVAKVSGITIVPIDFSGHDMCAGQRAGSTAEAWVFAPTGDLFLSWSTGVSGGSEHVRIAITGRCPDETQDPPHISGSGSGKRGPFSWTYFYVVIMNCSPHPTADGQAAIAGTVRAVLGV